MNVQEYESALFRAANKFLNAKFKVMNLHSIFITKPESGIFGMPQSEQLLFAFWFWHLVVSSIYKADIFYQSWQSFAKLCCEHANKFRCCRRPGGAVAPWTQIDPLEAQEESRSDTNMKMPSAPRFFSCQIEPRILPLLINRVIQRKKREINSLFSLKELKVSRIGDFLIKFSLQGLHLMYPRSSKLN